MMNGRSTHPRTHALRAAGTLLAVMAFAVLETRCDAYECTSVSCDNGGSWDRCIACYDDSCTYEARDDEGEVHDTCDYKTDDKGERDGCYAQTNAAGESICSGEPVDPGGGCKKHSSCEACTDAGCAYCAPAGECQDYDTATMCAEPTIDLPSDCEMDPGPNCAQYVGCVACTDAGCAYCAPAGECQDYAVGASCAEPTIDLSSDCGG